VLACQRVLKLIRRSLTAGKVVSLPIPAPATRANFTHPEGRARATGPGESIWRRTPIRSTARRTNRKFIGGRFRWSCNSKPILNHREHRPSRLHDFATAASVITKSSIYDYLDRHPGPDGSSLAKAPAKRARQSALTGDTLHAQTRNSLRGGWLSSHGRGAVIRSRSTETLRRELQGDAPRHSQLYDGSAVVPATDISWAQTRKAVECAGQ